MVSPGESPPVQAKAASAAARAPPKRVMRGCSAIRQRLDARGARRVTHRNGVRGTLTPAMLIRTSDAVKGMCRFLPSQAGSATLERTMSESETRTRRAKTKPPATSADGAAPSEAEAKAAVEPLTFREKLEAGRFVVSVEVDPPHGLGARKAIEGTRLLKEAGVDVINVGDSPTAKIRMSPLAMSTLLMREVGVEIVMHYTTRDRNAMAIHSDMVGAR